MKVVLIILFLLFGCTQDNKVEVKVITNEQEVLFKMAEEEYFISRYIDSIRVDGTMAPKKSSGL